MKPLLVPIQLTDLDYARVVIGPVSYPVKRETNHESHLKARTTRERKRERERECRTFIRRVSPGPLLLDELCFPIHTAAHPVSRSRLSIKQQTTSHTAHRSIDVPHSKQDEHLRAMPLSLSLIRCSFPMKMPRQLEEKPNFPQLKKHGRSLGVSVSFERDFDELVSRWIFLFWLFRREKSNLPIIWLWIIYVTLHDY